MCTVNRCEVVPTLEHGHADSRLSLEGTVINYKCDAGFHPTTASRKTDETIQDAMESAVNIFGYCNGTDWNKTMAECTRTLMLWLIIVSVLRDLDGRATALAIQ